MKLSRILVVDDTEVNRYLLRALLQGHGYEVDEAHHGAEALDVAQRNPPDLIISDILMPVMDGFALCREWKKDERLKLIPFIFYTATYTDEKDRKFALSLGAERFIVKPEEPEAFMAIIRETMTKFETGKPVILNPPTDEVEYYKEYNTALIRKLEDKMLQLEEANRILECDIEKRKLTEEALRESEETHRALVAGLPDIVMRFDRDGRHLYVSANFSDVVDLQPAQLIGKTHREMGLPEAQCRYYDEAIKRVFDSGAIFETEVTIEGKHGPVIHNWRLVPERDAQGMVRTVLSISRDITVQRRTEEENARLEAQLQQAQKMESVGRLAGGVAHDFNNMLGVILGHTEMALDQVDASLPLHTDLEEIRKAACRSVELTRQLLAFARKQTVAPKVLDLNEILAGMLKMLQRLIGENIHINWQPKAGLWPVNMDPSQIDQILANLCVNARDAISGVGQITIELGNSVFDEKYCGLNAGFIPGEFVLLAVSDNGCGMDKGLMAHLFEPFFTTKETGKGTGLGLATVYGIVKQNNGFITVYSELDQGTVFNIYLPRHTGKAETARSESISRTASPGKETILLVEDEPAILELTKKILVFQGYTVLAANTPAKALRMAHEYPGEIHLLMTDMVMPEMNGRELAMNLTPLHPNIKQLFMSGYTIDVIAHNCVLDEGISFIQKPFTIKELSLKVRETLESK